MVGPTRFYQELAADYTVQRIKRKGPAVYLEVDSATDDAKPSDIMAMFLLLPL
jgi:hypothetical protein